MNIFKILKSKKIIVLIIILLVIIGGSYKVFFSDTGPVFSLAKVEIRDIVQEVSAIGQVKKGEEINLSFKNAGRIEEVLVKVGDKVESGKELIRLETTQLYIQLAEAQAALDLVEAELDKLKAGSSPEEIQVAQTAIYNAEIAYEDAKQNLEDVKEVAENSLESAYEDSLNILDDSYLKIYNVYNEIDNIQRNYFINIDQESNRVRQQKSVIEEARDETEVLLDTAKADSTEENIDAALSKMKEALNDTYNALIIIRSTCEELNYRNVISSTDKTALDTHKGYVNAALTNVTNSQQTVSYTKLSNNSNINTAQASVSTAKGTLDTAKDNLALILAPPRQEDLALYKAQVERAKASVALLENQIGEVVLKSFLSGQITGIEKEIGEQVIVGEVVVHIIPEEPFQIELDISEADIGKVDILDPVKITLDAFPQKEHTGKVLEIEPAETIISGVVYYKTKISLETEDEKIKPGMTADVIIVTDSRNQVLSVPQRAVTEKDGKKTVKVPSGKSFTEIEVETGLKGVEGFIEIVSGLLEEEEVITFIKNNND